MKIEIKNLVKSYGAKEVLKGVNLEINNGMFGLLGPNGAGKTTLMRILTTLISKTDGVVTINGIDIKDKRRIREIIGYLPQEFSFYPDMTCYEVLDYLAILSGIKSQQDRKALIIKLLEKVNLKLQIRTKVKVISGGMKRRLGIAQALINNPKILVVDEPTAGLDPEERVRFRNLLRDFSVDRIVILSTHIVEDIESSCENLAILKEGRVIYQGKVTDMLNITKGNLWTAIIDKEEMNILNNKYPIISSFSEGDKIKIKVLSSVKPVENAYLLEPTIEDAYIKYIRESEVC